MTSTKRFAAAILAAALAGCATESTPVESGRPATHSTVRIQAERGGAEVPMSDADLLRWANRFTLHLAKGRTACGRELVHASPDIALENFRRLVGRTDHESTVLRARIAIAWEEAFTESALRESETARTAHAEATAAAVDMLVAGLEARNKGAGKIREAGGAFEAIGDAFWAEECRRLSESGGATVDEAPRKVTTAPTTAQADLRTLETCRAAVLGRRWAEVRELLPVVMDSTLARHDFAFAVEVEDVRSQPEVAASFGPQDTRRWLVGLGELALSRGLHLLALRYSMTARDAAPAGIDTDGRNAARRLFARASSARGDRPLALRAAEGILDDARNAGDRAEEARASAVYAEILLDDSRAKEAAGMFLHAAKLEDELSLEADAARHHLGAATSFLAAGLPSACVKELEVLAGTSFGATSSVGRRARLTSAVLAASHKDSDECRARADKTLADAEAAGDTQVVEQCEALKEKLK